MTQTRPRHLAGALGSAVIVMLFSVSASAQGLPATDLWLAKIVNGAPGQPVKISQGAGYNNQPHFSADGSVIYFTREMPVNDGAAQTDIAAYDLQSSATTMVTHTPESEYSPTPMPGRNALSVIHMNLEQKQYLYAIDIASGDIQVLLPDVEPVGYHAWVSRDEVAMFILGDSMTLQTARPGIAGTTLVADNIGRSLRRHPSTGEILFVDKNSEPWQIAAFDPTTQAIRVVMPLFPDDEDFTIDSSGRFWTGNGARLYSRAPDDERWVLMADYRGAGVGRITRLAIDPQAGLIALVGDHL